jgi:hypothetical protein
MINAVPASAFRWRSVLAKARLSFRTRAHTALATCPGARDSSNKVACLVPDLLCPTMRPKQWRLVRLLTTYSLLRRIQGAKVYCLQRSPS